MKQNRLDEMKELKLLHIEEKAYNIAFYGLCILILIKAILTGFNDLEDILGEIGLILILALYVGISCIKEGIWDVRYVPTTKTNTVYSLIGGILSSCIFGYKAVLLEKNVVLYGILGFLGAFLVMMLILKVLSILYYRRFDKLENGDDE